MHIVFLSDTHADLIPVKRVDDWLKELPLSPEDRVSLFYYDVICANLFDDEYFNGVMDTMDGADLLIACGLSSEGQWAAEERSFFCMPDLVNGNHEKVYIRSKLHTLKVVIDTLRGKTY